MLSLAACARDLEIRRARSYAEPGGKKLGMTFYGLPEAGGEARPGIVVIHGGGWLIGPRWQQRWYCHEFARAGYVVMSISYRRMPRHPFPACLEDSKAAVRWMRLHADELGVDPNRIVAFGASAGGHLAAFLACPDLDKRFEGEQHPGVSSDVRAAISLYGAVDLSLYRDMPHKNINNRGARRFIKRFVRGVPALEGHDAFEAASPITYIRPEMAPVFLAHGTHDPIVHFEQSMYFYERMKEEGVPARLIVYPKRGHGFDYVHHEQRRTLFAEMLDFLEEHLSGGSAESAI